ncbi:hypothetical protein D3C86_1349250 [compost metagenome]
MGRVPSGVGFGEGFGVASPDGVSYHLLLPPSGFFLPAPFMSPIPAVKEIWLPDSFSSRIDSVILVASVLMLPFTSPAFRFMPAIVAFCLSSLWISSTVSP